MATDNPFTAEMRGNSTMPFDKNAEQVACEVRAYHEGERVQDFTVVGHPDGVVLDIHLENADETFLHPNVRSAILETVQSSISGEALAVWEGPLPRSKDSHQVSDVEAL